jgi:hypothetical protein
MLLCFFNTADGSTPGNFLFFHAKSSFLNNANFVVGFKGGFNFTMAIPTQRFSVIQSVNGINTDALRKDYSPFYSNPGYQYGFIGMLRINRSISISLEPTFATYTFNYTALSQWHDASDPSDRMDITNEFTNDLKYFEIPLVLRYEFGNGQIRPYLAAGFFYGLLTGVSGNWQATSEQYIDGTLVASESDASTGDVSGNYIKTRLATFPGAGVFIDFNYITFFAEADYYISLHNIVNESARYSNSQSVGSHYDVPDNLKFNNAVINFGFLFNISQNQSGGGNGSSKGSAVECPPAKRKR